jgi:HemY protein
MRLGLWALLALLLGAFAAHFVLEDRGYVLITFRGYVVEMSVPGMLLVLVALYFAVRGIAALARLPRSLRARAGERRVRRGGEDLGAGLMHLIEGDSARAERVLTRGGAAESTPFASYLLAARAAQAQGERARRDEWLALAYDAGTDTRPAVLLARAELELDAGELDAALATLERLEKLDPDHAGAVGLLARVYRARHDAAGLRSLLPRLASARLPAAERDALAAEALRIELASPELGSERLDELWAEVGADLRASPAALAMHARSLERLGRGDEAERELRAALKRSWSADLVLAYGEVEGPDRAKQLKQAETWLKTRPDDAPLLLTAARLCIANELWGKARTYLESSLALAPSPTAYALYGDLLTVLNEPERAALAFRTGLGLASPPAADALHPIAQPDAAAHSTAPAAEASMR